MKKSVLREENIKHYNHDGYDVKFLVNTYEYANIKSQNRRVHLAYNPV